MHINSKSFYSITNVVLGTSFSLDAADPKGGSRSGLVDITPSGLSSGQTWQLLNPNQPDKGPYYLSSSIAGPHKKLDVGMSDKTTCVPYVKKSHNSTRPDLGRYCT